MNRYTNNAREIRPTIMVSIKSKLLTPPGVKFTGHKKHRQDGDINKISHSFAV
jgi:hypothetical protein